MSKPAMFADILLVGGGLVGGAFAKAAECLPHDMMLVDPNLSTPTNASTKDNRKLVLTHASKEVFDALGIWPSLVQYSTPIEHIHVSQKGHFGITRLNAAEVGLPTLGYTILLSQLQACLSEATQQLSKEKKLKLQTGTVIAVEEADDHWRVMIEDPQRHKHSIRAKHLIAADGTTSKVRELLNIPTQTHDYEQVAIVTRVTVDKPHHNTAYERFTTTGAIALLPMSGDTYGLVWTVPSEQRDEYLNMSDELFLQCLQKAFGYRTGKFKAVEKRAQYPLISVIATQNHHTDAILLGNAAQTLHPIAAQGYNLGLRDIMQVVNALKGDPVLSKSALAVRYRGERAEDRNRWISLTDGLASWFSIFLPGVPLLRGMGMFLLDQCTFLKKKFLMQGIYGG